MRSEERRIRRVYRKGERRPGDAGRGSRPGEAGERRLFIRPEREERGREGKTRRDEARRRAAKGQPGQREKMIKFDNFPQEIVQALCTPMHQILLPPPAQHLGHLWLGSFAAISDADLLRIHRISHLVQVIDVPWLPPVNDPSMTVTRIDIMDIPSADLKSHLDDACARIEKSLAAGKNVLVHCHQVHFTSHPSISPHPLSSLSRVSLAALLSSSPISSKTMA